MSPICAVAVAPYVFVGTKGGNEMFDPEEKRDQRIT